MKKIYASMAALAAAISVNAQPVLNASNTNPTIGETYTMHQAVSYVGEGASGAGVTWDFSSLTSAQSSVVTIVAASSTPNAGLYPGADLAQSFDGFYQYFSVDANGMTHMGSEGNGQSIPYSDPEKFLEYPFTYNSTINDNLYSDYNMSGIDLDRSGSVTITADAYGTLILPYGTYNNVLRVRMHEIYDDYLDGTAFSMFAYDLDTYSYYLPGMSFPLVSVKNMTMNGTPLNAVTYADGASVLISGVEEEEDLFSSFNFFPNPAEDELHLIYNLKENSEVRLSVKNSMGQEVLGQEGQYLLQGPQSQDLNLSELQTGIYFVEMEVNGKLSVKKFMKK